MYTNSIVSDFKNFYKELIFMASLEEKVKAFLSDEKKMEAIARDEAFLEKVSGGTATPEEIAKKFGSLGLPLTKDEAAQVKETTAKALHTPLEQLGGIELENISGGGWKDFPLYHGGLFMITAGGVSGGVGLGCWIAGKICQSQATKAALAGDKSKSKKLTKAVQGLDNATGACLGVAGVAGIGGRIMFEKS